MEVVSLYFKQSKSGKNIFMGVGGIGEREVSKSEYFREDFGWLVWV